MKKNAKNSCQKWLRPSSFKILFLSTFSLLLRHTHATPENEILLREYPMIYSHNAATGYMSSAFNAWHRNQDRGFAGQLDCGVRALDIRPKTSYGLKFHHGDKTVSKTFKSAVTEIMDWLKEKPQELVVLVVKHCSGSDCYETTAKELADLGIAYITDCSSLISMTYGEAKELGKLQTGGSIVAVKKCINENYDPNVECYHAPNWYGRRLESIHTEDTWDDIEVNNTSIERRNLYATCYHKHPDTYARLWKAVKKVTDKVPSADDAHLESANAHWQYTRKSIVAGVLHGSSVLIDEERSDVNYITAEKLANNEFTHINLLQLNHVCHNGEKVYKELQRIIQEKAPSASPTSYSPTSAPMTSSPTSAPMTSSPTTSSPTQSPTINIDDSCKAIVKGKRDSCVFPFIYKYKEQGIIKKITLHSCPTVDMAKPFKYKKKGLKPSDRWCIPNSFRSKLQTDKTGTLVYNTLIRDIPALNSWAACRECKHKKPNMPLSCPPQKFLDRCPKLDFKGCVSRQKSLKCKWCSKQKVCVAYGEAKCKEENAYDHCRK